MKHHDEGAFNMIINLKGNMRIYSLYCTCSTVLPKPSWNAECCWIKTKIKIGNCSFHQMISISNNIWWVYKIRLSLATIWKMLIALLQGKFVLLKQERKVEFMHLESNHHGGANWDPIEFYNIMEDVLIIGGSTCVMCIAWYGELWSIWGWLFDWK